MYTCELPIFSRGPRSPGCRFLHCGWDAVPCGRHICGGCYSNPIPKHQRKAEGSPEVGIILPWGRFWPLIHFKCKDPNYPI